MPKIKTTDLITNAAKKVAKRYGWKPITPRQCCKIIDNLADLDLTLAEIAEVLNKRKIVRGNYRRGSCHWQESDVSMLYRYHTGKAVIAGTKAKLHGNGGGKRLPKGTSDAAKAFVQKHPDWTVVSDTRVVTWMKQLRKQGKTLQECVDLANQEKALRANYRSDGSPKFSTSTLGHVFRQHTGEAYKQKANGIAKKAPTKKYPTFQGVFTGDREAIATFKAMMGMLQ